VRVQVDKVASGGSQFVRLLGRHVTSGTEYRFKVRFDPQGRVWVRAGKVVGNTTTDFAEVPVAGLSYSANQWLWVRGEVVGTNPTTLRIRVWADGQAEPAT